MKMSSGMIWLLIGALGTIFGIICTVTGTIKVQNENRKLSEQNALLQSNKIDGLGNVVTVGNEKILTSQENNRVETKVEHAQTRSLIADFMKQVKNLNTSTDKFLKPYKNKIEDFKYPCYIKLMDFVRGNELSEDKIHQYLTELENLNKTELEIIKWANESTEAELYDMSDFRDRLMFEKESTQEFLQINRNLAALETKNILQENNIRPDFPETIELTEYGKLLIRAFDLKNIRTIKTDWFNEFLGRKDD